MPISSLASRSGVLNADDLALVRRVFDSACASSLKDKHAFEAEAVAARIVAEYLRGVRDETELLSAALQESAAAPRMPKQRHGPWSTSTATQSAGSCLESSHVEGGKLGYR
jgi:hypothetical protein